jgi:hypothetical protein
MGYRPHLCPPTSIPSRISGAAGLRPGPRRVRVGRLHDSADGPETHTLRVPITHRGQSILARRGKLPIRLSPVFTPDGGQSSRQARQYRPPRLTLLSSARSAQAAAGSATGAGGALRAASTPPSIGIVVPVIQRARSLA